MEKLSQDMGASPVATPARAQRTDPQEQKFVNGTQEIKKSGCSS